MTRQKQDKVIVKCYEIGLSIHQTCDQNEYKSFCKYNLNLVFIDRMGGERSYKVFF